MTSQRNSNTNTIPEPNWMKEECVQSIPKEKLQFLQKLVFESSSLSQKELLPFLMALAQKSYEASISFSDTEISSILTAIRKYATPEEHLKMNQIVRLMARKEGVKLPPSGCFQETFRVLNFSDMETFCDPSVP